MMYCRKKLLALMLALALCASVCPARAAEAPVTLRVLGDWFEDCTAFTAETGIQVQEAWRGDNMMETLSVMMVTGSSEADLICGPGRVLLDTLAKKDFYTDLSQDPALAALAEEWYPFVREGMADGEAIMAWPLEVSPGLCTYDERLFEAAGLTFPSTWEELLEVLPRLVSSDAFLDEENVVFDTKFYQKDEMICMLTQEYLLAQYGEEKVTLDTPVYRALAERILEEVPDEDPFPNLEGNANQAILFGMGAQGPTNNLALPFSFADRPSGVEADVTVLVVNPKSRHLEEALALVRYLAGKRGEESRDYFIYTSLTEPFVNPRVEKSLAKYQLELAAEEAREVKPEEEKDHETSLEALRTIIARAEQNRYLVTREAIASYAQYQDRIKILRNEEFLWSEELQTMMKQLTDGKLSLDAFIQKAEMYFYMVAEEK